MIEFVKKGILTTIQDGGRYRYQRFGVPVSGAMDLFALALANILVGNPQDTEAVEATIIGPTIKFRTANIFAVTGGNFEAKLNGQPVKNNKAYLAQAGSLLELSMAKEGARAYVAFSGGLDADCVMGSRSTYLKGGIGGVKGRAVANGDTLRFRAPQTDLPNMKYRAVPVDFLVSYGNSPKLRIVLGPQDNYFSQKGIETLLSSEYTVGPENDRMGYRLEGPEIEQAEGCDENIISDGISFGAIQVPQHQPIVMMADRQTTGGYAKIGCIISVDLPLIAQLKTCDKMRFQCVSVEEAQALYLKRRRLLKELADMMDKKQIIQSTENRVRINGQEFHVVVQEIK